jgi:S1-C subfamily serine protease
MNRLVYILAFFVILYGLFNDSDDEQGDSVRRPPPARVDAGSRRPPRAAPGVLLPPPSGQDSVLVVDAGKKASSSGTAFALGGGWWLTARHVVDGCTVVGLLTGPRRGVRARAVHLHPSADAALLRVPLKSVPFKMASAPIRRGQIGFSIGYPQGGPGEVFANLIGRKRLRTRGRFHNEEPALVWAEKRRVPSSLPALGGLSGGPMFNADGSVVGILVAASERRGRVITAAPVTITELLARNGVTGQVRRGVGALNLSPGNFSKIGDQLRARHRIAKVLCRVGEKRRRGRDR